VSQLASTSVGTPRSTYTTYSIGCAAVWAGILAVSRRRLDSEGRSALRLVCGGWWIGWTSATIARVSFPPPKKLTPEAEAKLRVVSLVLVAGGLINVIRLLIAGRPPASSSAHS
jgi:hypothetical protein